MKEFLRNLFIGDWMLKVFSLGLAILTWLAVSFVNRQRPIAVRDKPVLADRVFSDMPVTAVSSDGDVRGFKVKPAEVNVKIRGAIADVDKLRREHMRIQVDVTGAPTNSGTKRRLDLIAPPGIAPMIIEPEEVEVTPPSPTPAPPAKNGTSTLSP